MGTTCSRLSVGGTLDAATHQGARTDGSSRCLDAFAIALSQAYDRVDTERAWYVSTRQLQLTSSDFCRICRSVPTLHLHVARTTPRTLWAPRESGGQRQSLPCSTSSSAKESHTAQALWSRVPAVRAAGLAWYLGENLLTRGGVLQQWGDLRYLCLVGGGTWSGLESMEWPRTLKTLTLNTRIAAPQHVISWPANLQELSLGLLFNQPMPKIVWPTSLRRLSFEPRDYKSIERVVWPASLEQLSFGQNFDFPIAGIVWPAFMQRMSLGNKFNQPLAGVVWPAPLQQLSFGFTFNQPIAGVAWPASLRRLSFGYRFNQPIAGVVWPAALQRLSFRRWFDQPIDGVVWPASLQSVTREGESLLRND